MGNRMSTSHDRARRRRGRAAGFGMAVAGAVVALAPSAAWAHAEFTSNASVPANSDQRLTLNVPEEKGASIHNTKVTFVVAAGFKAGGCDPKPQWSCAVAGASNGRSTVTYTRSAGTDADARFSFGVHTPPKPGDYAFETIQSYSDNSTVRWNGAPDSETPAPVLRVG